MSVIVTSRSRLMGMQEGGCFGVVSVAKWYQQRLEYRTALVIGRPSDAVVQEKMGNPKPS